MGLQSTKLQTRGLPVDDFNPLPVGTSALPNMAAAHEGPVTVNDTAALLTALITLHAATQRVVLTVETTSLRLTVNGTTPTTTLGLLYAVNAVVSLSRAEAVSARLIRATGSNSAIQVAQYL